jgi:hypothetical protein
VPSESIVCATSPCIRASYAYVDLYMDLKFPPPSTVLGILFDIELVMIRRRREC